MNNDQIVQQLKLRLNREGESFGLRYEVSRDARPDGEWTQFNVRTNETRANSAASRQIIANIGSDIVGEAGREIVLILVSELLNAA